MQSSKIWTPTGFRPLQFIPTKDQIARATERFEQSKRDCLAATGEPFPKNSITKGSGRLAGFLLEEIFVERYHMTLNRKPPKNFDDPDCFWHYDAISRWLLGKVEIKAKRRSCPARDYFNGTVSAHFTRQLCDYYVFGSVLYDLSLAEVCGIMRPKDFYARATKAYKGDIDPESPWWDPWRWKGDCFNLHYDQMQQMPDLSGSIDDIDPQFLVQENLHELYEELHCAS